MIEIGADNIPGFDEQIIGMNVGETKTFTLTYPEDYPGGGAGGRDRPTSPSRSKKSAPRKSRPWMTSSPKRSPTAKSRPWTRSKTTLRADMEKALIRQRAERGGSGAHRPDRRELYHQVPAAVRSEAEVDDDAKGLHAPTGKAEGVTLRRLPAADRADARTADGRDPGRRRQAHPYRPGAGRDRRKREPGDRPMPMWTRPSPSRPSSSGTTPAAMRAFLESQQTA